MTIKQTIPAASPGASPPGGSTKDATGLRGNLGTASLVFTVIAYNGPLICLAGIVPLVIALGNGLGAPATFGFLGLLVLIFAVGLNAMASRMTHAGAFYTYVTAGIGRSTGLSAGVVAIAAYVALCAGVFPLFASSVEHILSDVFGIQGGPPWPVWAAVGWLIVSALSMFNIELSAKVLGTASAAEIILTVIWNFRVYVNGGPEGRSVDVMGSLFSGSPAFALVLGILCLTGFESLQVFRSETKDPLRTVPRATYISVGVLTAMYAISSLAYIVAFGASKAVDSVGDDPTGAVLGSVAQYVAKPAADIANILLTTSTFAATLAITNILARYLFAFAQDGVAPSALARVNAKHGSPVVASAAAAAVNFAVVAVVVVAGMSAATAFATLTSFGAYCLVLLYVVTSLAILVFFLKRREPGTNKLQVFVAPLASTAGMAFIAYLSTVHFAEVLGQPQGVASTCLGIIVAMVVAAFLSGAWFRRYRPDTYARIGKQAETV
jgi:amino acid transporter